MNEKLSRVITFFQIKLFHVKSLPFVSFNHPYRDRQRIQRLQMFPESCSVVVSISSKVLVQVPLVAGPQQGTSHLSVSTCDKAFDHGLQINDNNWLVPPWNIRLRPVSFETPDIGPLVTTSETMQRDVCNAASNDVIPTMLSATLFAKELKIIRNLETVLLPVTDRVIK
jgi:hypothetical protein